MKGPLTRLYSFRLPGLVRGSEHSAIIRAMKPRSACGLTHLRQRRIGSGGSNSAGKFGEDLAEDQSGKTGGNAFLVKTAFLDGALVKRARVGRPSDESFPPEDERKHLQPATAIRFREGEQTVVMAGEIEKRREIHLEKCSETDRAP